MNNVTYTVHPFGDEWLWGEGGEEPLIVSYEGAAKAAEDERTDLLRRAERDGGENLREMAECMWFTAKAFFHEDPERLPEHVAALIGPDGTAYAYDDPRCLFLYEGIGADGKWPTPYPGRDPDLRHLRQANGLPAPATHQVNRLLRRVRRAEGANP